MEIFTTPRLRIRHLTAADADNWFRINGDPEIMRYIRPVKTREESDLFLLETIMNYDTTPDYGRWLIEDIENGQFVGNLMLRPLEGRSELEVGYALVQAYWGKGYGTELMKGAVRHAAHALHRQDILALTDPENKASQQILLKCGFKYDQDIYADGVLSRMYKL